MKDNETGQALIATAFAGMALVAAVAWVADMGELFNRKTRMQIAADVAASAGSASLASSLNVLKISNLVLVGATGASGLATLFGHAEGQEGVKAIEAMQEAIIKADGKPSIALAIKVGKDHGASQLNPFNFNPALGNFDTPHLDAERKKTKLGSLNITALTGWSGKLAMDKANTNKKRPYGERYVYVGAIQKTDDLQGSRLFPFLKHNSRFSSLVSSSLSVVTGGKLWPLGGFFVSEMAPVTVLKRKGLH